jgi:hypothetical protein
MRSFVTWLLALGGLALTIVGYFLAAPWGSSSEADSNPIVVGAPLIFILGIVSILAAAVFYELLPGRGDDGTG